MEKIIKKRRVTKENKPKNVKSISFSGDEGYEALGILEKNNHILGNSGLVIDLLRIYGKYKEKENTTSDDEAVKMLSLKLGVEI